jgi:hypothetical protein
VTAVTAVAAESKTPPLNAQYKLTPKSAATSYSKAQTGAAAAVARSGHVSTTQKKTFNKQHLFCVTL